MEWRINMRNSIRVAASIKRRGWREAAQNDSPCVVCFSIGLHRGNELARAPTNQEPVSQPATIAEASQNALVDALRLTAVFRSVHFLQFYSNAHCPGPGGTYPVAYPMPNARIPAFRTMTIAHFDWISCCSLRLCCSVVSIMH